MENEIHDALNCSALILNLNIVRHLNFLMHKDNPDRRMLIAE